MNGARKLTEEQQKCGGLPGRGGKGGSEGRSRTSAHGGEVLAPGHFEALPRGGDVSCGVALAGAGRGVDQHQV